MLYSLCVDRGHLDIISDHARVLGIWHVLPDQFVVLFRCSARKFTWICLH